MPLVIRHRINSIAQLRAVPREFGVEIDIRYNPVTGRLHLTHFAHDEKRMPIIGDDFEEYMKVLSEQGNRFAVFNPKEMGIEDMILEIAEKFGVQDFFFLDEEFPYIYRAAYGNAKDAVKGRIAIRYSEAEPIEQALHLAGKFKWVWADTNTKLSLTRQVHDTLRKAGFMICLVCPERWGRPQDIDAYIRQMRIDGVMIDAVMTAEPYAKKWKESGVILPYKRSI